MDEFRQQHDSPNDNATGQGKFPSKQKCRGLHVGCGNSQLGEHMLHGGYTEIVNVDYSKVVIRKSELIV